MRYSLYLPSLLGDWGTTGTTGDYGGLPGDHGGLWQGQTTRYIGRQIGLGPSCPVAAHEKEDGEQRNRGGSGAAI
jgi:hypothetical protein